MAHLSQPATLTGQENIPSSGFGKALQSPLTFGLLLSGGVGAVLFTAIYLLLGITRPGYDAWQQPISALGLGPGGWVEQANFIGYGLLLIVSAFGWYRLLKPLPGAIWFLALQSLAGLCLIGAGFFSMDSFPGYPPGNTTTISTMHGTLHTIFAFTLIIALAESCFVLAAYFGRILRWRGWAAYSIITGVLMLIFWGAFVRYPTESVAGLVERLSAGSHDLWMCVLLVMLIFQRRSQRG